MEGQHRGSSAHRWSASLLSRLSPHHGPRVTVGRLQKASLAEADRSQTGSVGASDVWGPWMYGDRPGVERDDRKKAAPLLPFPSSPLHSQTLVMPLSP